MRLLVIGCGSIGRRHALNARALGADLVLADAEGARAARVADELSGAVVFTDYRDALRDRPPDAAVIAAPTAVHVPIATVLATQRVPFLVEKPLSHTLEGVEALLSLVEQHQVTAMMGHSFRFHEGFLRLSEVLAAGEIGTVYHAIYYTGWFLPDWHVSADYRTEYAARQALGGGVALTTFGHAFDLAAWLFGEITDITGWTLRLSTLETDVDDAAACLLRTSRGAVVTCVGDFLSRRPRHELFVIGSEGHLRADFWAHRIAVWRARGRRFPPGAEPPAGSGELFKVLADGVTYDMAEEVESYAFDPNRRYVDELRYFFDRVAAGDVAFDLDLHAGARVLRLVHDPRFQDLTSSLLPAPRGAATGRR